MPAGCPHEPGPFRGKTMTHRQILEQTLSRVLAKLSDERVRQILDFAEFLSLQEEQKMWAQPGGEADELGSGAEDEYTEADARTPNNP